MFSDRNDAGRRLAAVVRRHPELAAGAVVLGLPRGGVPVARQVADAIGAPLDVIVVRKVGAPFQRELALGAIGEDGVRVVDDELMSRIGVTAADFAAVEREESAELARRAARYRSGRPAVDLDGRPAIIIDDGIATGSTARAACSIARARQASTVVLAVPVAPAGWAERLGDAADAYLCVEAPARFDAVGSFYRDFDQVDDDVVIACLGRGAPESTTPLHDPDEVS